MADCLYYEELISASMDGALTAEEEAALATHLQSCESCRAYHAALRSIAKLDEELPPVPADLTKNIMAAVHAAAPAKKKAVIIPFPRRVRAIVAAAAVMALAVWAGARTLTPKGRMEEAAAPEMGLRMSAAAPAAATGEYETEAAEEEAVNGSMLMMAYDAAEEPALLRSADGEEREVADAALWALGEETDAPAPEREPDYTIVNAEGELLWELWEEDGRVLFREVESGAMYTAEAQRVWDALG